MNGQLGAVYVEGDSKTAVAELDRIAQKQGLTRRDLTPRLLLPLALSVRQVLDLTSLEIQKEWGLTDADLTAEDFGHCPEVTAAARRAEYEAIRFPSAAPGGGENYAVFLDCLAPGSHLGCSGRYRRESRETNLDGK